MGKIVKLIRFDWAIKNILRDKSNFVILEGFLSELLKESIKIIEILESESNQKNSVDKFNRVDLLVKLKSGEFVIIEIQNQDEYDYLQRILYGASKVITEHMKMGNSYGKVKKVISVSIVYFDLGHGKDYVYHGKTVFKGIHTNDNLELSEEQKTIFNKEEPHEIFPEYYILKVNKFDEITKDGLDEWIYFLKTDEIMENFKAKGLIEAKEKLDVLRMSKKERAIYENYLEDLHLKASLADTQKFKIEFAEKKGLEKGLEKGLQEGIQRGLEKGRKKEQIEIVKNGNKEGLSNEILSKLTKLSLDEIEEILKNVLLQENEE